MARGVNKVITLYESGKSIPQVAELTGVALSTVRYHLKKHGVLRSRAEGVRRAFNDGRVPSKKGTKRPPFSNEWKRNISAGKIKAANETASGRSLKPNGYIEITRGPHKRRLEHRVLMEKKLGRKLLSTEDVHHKDECRSNNDLDNLEVMDKSAHARHHALKNSPNRIRNTLGQYK